MSPGISYLGIPAYTFDDGLGFAFSALNYVVSCSIAAYAIVPFFHRLVSRAPSAAHAQGLYSAYEYLELRFSKSVRTAAAVVFVTRVVIYLSVVLCAPAIVLDTLTPLPAWAAILVCGAVATLYTIKVALSSIHILLHIQSNN
jgi:sodium-dependent multivitamin transporter 6